MDGVCGRYASSRSPDDLTEYFEVEQVATGERVLPPDYNVAPTKDVYAVLTRVPSGETTAHRSLRIVRWGLVPSWAKDPAIGNRMINAQAGRTSDQCSGRDGRREARLPPGVRAAAVPGTGGRLLRVVHPPRRWAGR